VRHRHDVNIEELFRGKEKLRKELAALPYNRKLAIALQLHGMIRTFRDARLKGGLFKKEEAN